MANEEHLAILKKGVAAWNEWRKQHPDIRPDLGGADLHGESRGEPQRGEPRGANLAGRTSAGRTSAGRTSAGRTSSGANLSRANLERGEPQRGEPQRGGPQRGGPQRGAPPRGEPQRGEPQRGEPQRGGPLRGEPRPRRTSGETDFSEATLGWTVFADVDLSTAKGLETVRHHGPSTIGVDTIYRSKGKIPEVFLRGAGLPDEFIAYIGSFVGRPIEFYSCFISYSGKDQEFADRLYEGLQNKGVRCWFAPHDVKAGEKLHEQIDEAIRLHDKLLLILSEHSMNSEWVKTEIFNAREREVAEKKRKLFPVRLVPFETLYDWKCFDAKTGKDLAREIAEYFIPDFANWKDHDSFQGGFERLLKDLKSPDAGAKSAAPAKD